MVPATLLATLLKSLLGVLSEILLDEPEDVLADVTVVV